MTIIIYFAHVCTVYVGLTQARPNNIHVGDETMLFLGESLNLNITFLFVVSNVIHVLIVSVYIIVVVHEAR